MRTAQPISTVILAATALALLAGSACGPGPALTVEQRTFASKESGYRYIAPPYWKVLRGEVRSPEGILITIQVLNLEDGDPKFIKGLPGTIVPQLEAWARHFYGVVGTPTQHPFTLGGEPGLTVRYPVRIRPVDPEASIVYWVARHGNRFYVLRAAIPPGGAQADAKGLDEFLASWQFIGPGAGGSNAPPGSFQLEVPEAPGDGGMPMATPKP